MKTTWTGIAFKLGYEDKKYFIRLFGKKSAIHRPVSEKQVNRHDTTIVILKAILFGNGNLPEV